MEKIYMIEINQPIGSFYIGKIKSDILIKITKTIRRKQNVGIQRALSEKRVNEIKEYCNDPDATFPTPIILSVRLSDINNNDKIANIKKSEIDDDIYEFTFDSNKVFAEILDGQHRVEGIKKCNSGCFELPIVVMFDLTEEEKAYVFSTINSNQTKVDKSLIYDLFELSTSRSPYKTCHEIARILNSNSESPFYRKLKMLGKKGNDTETLSQGTFVTNLCTLISKTPQDDMIKLKNGLIIKDDPSCPLRKYFKENQDEIILKIINNYFNAVKKVFMEEWENSEYILTKTVGYGALIRAFTNIYNEGIENRDLSKDFFVNKFKIAKKYLLENKLELKSNDFPSNEQVVKQLANIFSQTL